MDLSKFKTDPRLEVDGVEVQLGDATLTIARLNNPRAAAAYARNERRHRGAVVSEKIRETEMTEVLADCVLLDWKNVEMDGKPLEPTRENKIAALQIKDFADFVIEHARDFENYQAQQVSDAAEAAEKN